MVCNNSEKIDPKIKAARLSVMSNAMLVAGKLVVGLAIGSVGVISEGIHSSLDLLAALIAFFAVRQAMVMADKQHRYGHGKVENVSGTLEAVLILIAAIWIMIEAVQKLLHPHAVEALGYGILIMAISSITNYFISRHLLKVAIEADSIALKADAMHLRTDVLTALGVMFGLIGVYATGWQWLDPVSAVFVAGLIVHAAWELLKESFSPLLDASLPESEEKQILDKIMEHHEYFLDYHELRTRKSGSERHIDFHLTVCKYDTIEKAHYLSDRIEEDIKLLFEQSHVLVHQEPCDNDCRTCDKVKHQHPIKCEH